jgi:histidine ammonia-lyase
MGKHSNTRVTPGGLTLDELRAFTEGEQRVRLDESCWPAVEAAAEVVERAARGGAPVYGINTGFGKLATVRIAPDQIEELQRRLVLSHMCGLGPPLPDAAVRLIWR